MSVPDDESIRRWATQVAEEMVAPFQRDMELVCHGYEQGVTDTNKLAREWIVKCGIVAFLGGLVVGMGIMLLMRG